MRPKGHIAKTMKSTRGAGVRSQQSPQAVDRAGDAAIVDLGVNHFLALPKATPACSRASFALQRRLRCGTKQLTE